MKCTSAEELLIATYQSVLTISTSLSTLSALSRHILTSDIISKRRNRQNNRHRVTTCKGINQPVSSTSSPTSPSSSHKPQSISSLKLMHDWPGVEESNKLSNNLRSATALSPSSLFSVFRPRIVKDHAHTKKEVQDTQK